MPRTIHDLDPRAGQTTIEEDWQLIVAHCAPGADSSLMSTSRQESLRIFDADGFGNLWTTDGQQAVARDPQMLWDWSHIRDSSEPAKRRMASRIRVYNAIAHPEALGAR